MNTRRFISLILAVILIIAAFPSYAEDNYATRGEVLQMLLEAADFYNPAVEKSDIIKGYGDGNLHEDRNVSRAEALVMLSRAFGELPEIKGHNKRVALTAESFSDIPAWAESELKRVFDSGIAAGTGNGKFSPDSNVTRAQMELFIKRVYSLFGTNSKDDFYASVNKSALEKMEILPGNYSAGAFETLQSETANQLKSIINMLAVKNNRAGTPEQKIGDMYNCIMDTASRNKKGISPIKEYIERIDSVKNITELTMMNKVLMEELCVKPFLNFVLTVDLDDSSKHILCLETLRPMLGEEFYSGEKKEAYTRYLRKILTLGGESEETAYNNAEEFIKLEKELSKVMLDKVEENDVRKIYNVSSKSRISALFPDFDIETVIKVSGLKPAEKILVKDMSLAEKFSELYTQSNLDVLKTAMKIALLSEWRNTLSEDFLMAGYEFEKEVFKTEGEIDFEQIAVTVIQDIMPDYLGIIYSREYFDEESKRDVENMVNDILHIFSKRIDKLSWMSDATKKKAKLKLDTMNVKIGYAEVSDSYLDDVDIIPPKQGGTYFENMLAIKKALVRFYGSMQFSEVRHDMWVMNPYTVNAAYNASANDITFPAAVLQSPMYNKNASYEENLGGIGCIIAHEITHAFDHNGAKFDEKGNLSDWWSKSEYDCYDELCEKVTTFFDGEEAIPAVQNNGKLTLNENIADLGAAECITQLAKEKNADVGKMYEAMANVWANTSFREYAQYAAENDVHSNGKLRINRVLVNIDEFYNAFGITENDGMYVAPEKRIHIW